MKTKDEQEAAQPSDMKAAIDELTAKAREEAEMNEEVKPELETATGNKEKTE